VHCFLIWQERGRRAPGRHRERVRERLLRQWSQLFDSSPEVRVRDAGAAQWLWMELPVEGCLVPFFEEDGTRWAFSSEYPINSRRLLRRAGALPADGRALLAFAELLQRQRSQVLADAIPPFLLVSGDGQGDVRVQNDGLGQAQLFEYEDDQVCVFTNRVMLLSSLGVALRPVAEQWAARFTTGWFSGHSTGYENVRFARGGQQIRIHAGGVERTRYDPIGGWVKPPAMAREDALELGRRALHDALVDASELWRQPSVGLTGGRDSRAIVACLGTLDTPFRLRVRGAPSKLDVRIATGLCRQAGLELATKNTGGVPPGTAEGCRASILKALLWQAGALTTLKHKSFLAKANRRGLDGGVVNLMGQHAGIGKGDFAVLIKAHEHPPEKFEKRLLRSMMKSAPRYLRTEYVDGVRTDIRRAYRQAQDYGLEGRGPLHFYFLNEYTRRWGSATVNSQTGLVVTPFLCPDFIRACYAMPEQELVDKPMHKHITAYYAPEWAAYPFVDNVTEEDLRSGLVPAPTEDAGADGPKWRSGSTYHSFSYRKFWRDVGRPLLDEAFAEGGFWTQIFDPDTAREEYSKFKYGADVLVVAHLLSTVLRSPD